MKILVIGAGATGGYYGGRLQQAGRDVTFLVRERRAEQLRRTGLILRPDQGDEIQLTPKLLLAHELTQSFDLIFLSVKAYALDAAINDFAPAVGPQTMILPVLNGMRHIETLVARFGEERVLGGLCRISGDLDDEGRILQIGPLEEMAYGERNRELTPRIQAVDEQFQNATFKSTLSPDILAAMWVKWTLLSALGSINALGRGSVGEIAAIADFGPRLQQSVASESIAVATANGYPPSPESEAMVRDRVGRPGSPLEASMYRDLKKGLAVEADQIVGDMIARGRAHGVPTPLLEAAFVQLSVYEQKRTESKA